MMAKSEEDSAEICLDVFTEHYATLIEALPVKSLIAKFITAKIINFSDQDEIMKEDTAEEKARRFLQHISKPLVTRNCESLFKMLNVVEEHGGQYAYLAKNIKIDLVNRGVVIPDSKDLPDGIKTPASGVKLDINSLMELVVPNMATKWFAMGLQLEVNSKELKIIENDAKNSKEACRRMFTEWLDASSGEKSWKKVLDALCSRSVGENTLAKNLTYLA